MSVQDIYQQKIISASSAVDRLQNGNKIWAGGLLNIPVEFLSVVDERLEEFQGLELYSGLLTKPFKFLDKKYQPNLSYRSFFLGPIEKRAMKGGNLDFFLYHLGNLNKTLSHVDFDFTVIEVSPMNAEGYFSLGPVGGVGTPDILPRSKTVIVVVNKHQPFIGNKENLLHIDDVDFIMESHHSIAAPDSKAPSEAEQKIAQHILPFIKDGSTIQIGIGSLSNAVGFGLKNHKNLGIHTEMFTESMMELCLSGAVNGSQKNYYPNKIITAFAAGSQKLLDYVHHNDNIEIHDVEKVNDMLEIAKNDNFVSINTCIMTDFTGQVASEGVGHQQISGSGGQVDYVRGATLSKGGLSIIALSSTYKGPNGIESTILSELPCGTPVTTLRNDVQIIVTEYGAADLRGLTIHERIEKLIDIAHPDFREALHNQALACGQL